LLFFLRIHRETEEPLTHWICVHWQCLVNPPVLPEETAVLSSHIINAILAATPSCGACTFQRKLIPAVVLSSTQTELANA
jgi:hypothetical protein